MQDIEGHVQNHVIPEVKSKKTESFYVRALRKWLP